MAGTATADGGALAAMEARAVREKRRATFSAALGCGAGFLAAALWLALPPLWRVLNGDWSARVLPSLAALAGACAGVGLWRALGSDGAFDWSCG